MDLKEKDNGGYPKQIILIRHGEKKDGNELDGKGEKRAKQLVDFFLYDSRTLNFGVPFAIYAMKPHDKTGSLRPIETVTPLADKLGLKINKDYQKDDVKDLVKDMFDHSKYGGKLIVVCWEHTLILSIVKELGIDTPPCPKEWPDDIFDWAFLIDIDKNGKAIDFKCIKQHLLMDK